MTFAFSLTLKSLASFIGAFGESIEQGVGPDKLREYLNELSFEVINQSARVLWTSCEQYSPTS